MSKWNSFSNPMKRLCCCIPQPHITSQDIKEMVQDESKQMFNLRERYTGEEDIMDIRRELLDSHIPFRFRLCPFGSMACCGYCQKRCTKRCPQDVMFRARVLTAGVTPETMPKQTYAIQCLYKELHPADGEIVYAHVHDLVNDIVYQLGKEGKDKDHEEYRLDYAPEFEYTERLIRRPNGEEEIRISKKVDPKTGNISIVHWPRSGVCPFCWPTHVVDQRAIAKRRK